MKKSTIKAIIYSVLVFLMILSFHSYNNLILITNPPSDEWGRDIHIDISPYKKSVSIEMDEYIAEVFTAKEDRFVKTVVNRKEGRVINKEDIIIEDASLNKLVKYQACGQYIFWTENYTLFISSREQGGDYNKKNEILENVIDFTVLSKDNGIFLIAAFNQGLRVYRIDENGINICGEDYYFENPLRVSVSLDDKGVLHIASINKKSPIEREIIYLRFIDENWNLMRRKVEDIGSITEGIGNLEIGLDKDYAYIFYETNLWDKFGQSSKTWYTAFEFNNVNNIEMNFRMLLPDMEGYKESIFVSELKCDDYQMEELKVLYIKNDYDGVADGFRICSASFSKGEILRNVKVTKIIPWIKKISLDCYNDEYGVVFLQAAGEFKNEVWYTESGTLYKEAVKKGRADDYIRAIEDAISPYISGIVIALIKALIFLPALFWLIVVEVFEVKKFLRKPKLNYSIAMSIYMVIKIISADFYYTGMSHYLIPDILSFPGMKYVMMILISAIAYYITKEYKKSRLDMHIIAEFLLFMLYDLLITVFLYGPYIT